MTPFGVPVLPLQLVIPAVGLVVALLLHLLARRTRFGKALLAITQNPALFNLLGTTYGGNGRTTFSLPNLQGTAIVGTGTGPGLIIQAACAVFMFRALS